MPNTEIHVVVKSVYGKQRVYPNDTQAENLLRLTGKATFTNENLATIKDMGYRIVVDTPELPSGDSVI